MELTVYNLYGFVSNDEGSYEIFLGTYSSRKRAESTADVLKDEIENHFDATVHIDIKKSTVDKMPSVDDVVLELSLVFTTKD